MHTEGTILFSDPTLYDNREFRREKWRWEAATSLLDIGNTEATASSLLGVLSPYQNETKSMDLGSPPVQYLITGLRDPEPVFRALCATTRIFAANGFTENGLHAQLREKLRLLETLQSYLMAHRGVGPFTEFLLAAENLAKETLAYFLADDHQKTEIVSVFREIALQIEEREPDTAVQALHGRTLLGLEAATRVRDWTLDHAEDLAFLGFSQEELLDAIWPLVSELLSEEASRDTRRPRQSQV
ncbi:MAG: hypothetical protein ABSG60_13320 [Terracidiphilus sp.]|jgi:hypothetical protein